MILHAFASFVQIRKYSFAVFRKLSQAFAIHSFARFRKEWTFARIRQGFASAKIMVFRKDSQWALC